MRIWEVDENKAIPSNLVREQDFILRIRRLHRIGEPLHVFNVVLTHTGPEPIEVVQERLQILALSENATYAEMSNGDVFLVFSAQKIFKELTDKVTLAIQPSGAPLPADAFKVFHLPEEYKPLRERTFHYIDVSRDAAALAVPETSASQLLQTEAARGPLTAWSVDQIEKLLSEIDFHKYVKRQDAYEHHTDGSWGILFEEWFVSFDELRKVHFPKMEISPSDYLFHELCASLDRRLLDDLLKNVDAFASRKISVNIALPSVFGSAFSSFCLLVPKAYRSRLFCEINVSDLLQDFAMALNALATLKQEGFNVVLDGITPDMLPFVQFGLLPADFIKLNVSQQRFDQLNDLSMRMPLMSIPREKLIFYRCDHEEAVALGLSIGVTKYQGWYLDKAAAGNNPG